MKIPNSSKIILDLCGGTGAWAKPYKDAGYDVRTLTLPDFDVLKWGGAPEFMQLLHSNTVYGILAAPPCTQFSIARNDTTASTPRDMRSGMEVIQACLDIIHECLYQPYRKSENSLKFWALENPASGYLPRFLGEPALIFQPNEFGDPYLKKTAIWGMFNQPKKNPTPASLGTMVKHASGDHFKQTKHIHIPEGYQKKLGIDARTIARSVTPQGFAKAFMEANR